MAPIPHWKRRIFFYVFLVLFVVLIPAVLFYASGYRFGKNWQVVEVGGIYAISPLSGTEIYVDGILSAKTNAIERGVLLQNIKPGNHFVEMKKIGYTEWKKNIFVDNNDVTPVHAFFVPLEHPAVAVTSKISDENGNLVKNPEFDQAVSFFNNDLNGMKQLPSGIVSIFASSSLKMFSKNGSEILWNDGKNAFATWIGGEDSIPEQFCDAKGDCKMLIAVLGGNKKVIQSDFYPSRNDVMIIAVPGEIFASDIQNILTTSPNIVSLYRGGKDLEFRQNGDSEIFVRDGSSIFKVKLQ